MSEHIDAPSTDRIGLDRLFDSLCHSTRRRILLSLAEHNPRDVEECSVAAVNGDDTEWERRRAELHHNHLPRLSRAGIIEWDRDSNTITQGPNFDDVRPLLELIDDQRDELPRDWP